MSKCLGVQHKECTRCKQFFVMLTKLLTSTNPVYIKDQPQKMYKAAELASKLCTTDPMGGASADSEALIIQMMLVALRHDGYKSALVEQIRTNLMEHLEKQTVDAAMRARQSQSAQVLVRFLRCTGQDGAEPGHNSQQLARDLFTAKELLLRELVGLKCYKQNARNLNLHPALRMAQVIVMAGQDATVVAMLEHMPQELQHMVKGIYSEQRNSRSMSESPVLHVPSGGGVRGLLQVLEEVLTRARSNYLPSELYVSVSVSRADAAVKGTYRIDGSMPMPAANQAGSHQGLTYVKSVEHNVSYQIAKEVSTHTKDKTPIQIEIWVLSSIVGNKCTPLFRTEPRHLSADRCPRPTARWRCVQRSTQGEESDMQVLAQWSEFPPQPGMPVTASPGLSSAKK